MTFKRNDFVVRIGEPFDDMPIGSVECVRDFTRRGGLILIGREMGVWDPEMFRLATDEEVNAAIKR